MMQRRSSGSSLVSHAAEAQGEDDSGSNRVGRGTGRAHLTNLADAHGRLGHRSERLSRLTEAGKIIEATDERSHEAEVFRVQGDLMNATGDQPAAERSYRRALAVAERQSKDLRTLLRHQPRPDLARSGKARLCPCSARARLQLSLDGRNGLHRSC